MSGTIEAEIISLTSGSIVEQTLDLIVAVRTELILFCLAFLLHQLIFGSAFPRAVKRFRRKKLNMKLDFDGPALDSTRRPYGPPPGLDEYSQNAGSPSNAEQALRWSQQAFERGDHRSVMRLWNSLKRSDLVPAAHLAQIIETMQRSKKESSAILTEIENYLQRNKDSCHISFVNQLVEAATKSLDIELVNGLLGLLASMGIDADRYTYEMLLQMHFTTRNFQEVKRLSEEMQAKELQATPRTTLILLKAALQNGNLDESLRHFKESLNVAVPTLSQAPKHIMTQIVELACREKRMDAVLAEIDAGRISLTAEMVNTMLSESIRLRDAGMTERVRELAKAQKVDLNGRSYQHLIRGAGSDSKHLSKLLTEMKETGIECLHDVATSVLSVCAASNDIGLADQVYDLACKTETGHSSTMLAFVRFYAEADASEKACAVYDKHRNAQTSDSQEWRGCSLDSRTEKCLVSAAMQCGRKDIAAELMVSSPSDTAKHIGMIRNSASKGDLAEALSIFESLEASGAELTHSLFNSLLDACVECSDMKQAHTLMERMVASRMADAVSYNTLIKAHLKQDNYQGARKIMETMQRAGCKPNPVTYNELIHSLVRSEKESNRAQAWEVIEEMKAAGVRPNKVTCSILFRSLKARSAQADVVRIMELSDQMDEPMDEVLMSSIVEACVRIGKPGLLTEKLEQLQGKNGIKVTGAHTFGSLIKAYGTAHDMDGAWRCWKAMRSQHVKPTSVTIGCMVEAVVSNGDVDGGYELIGQLLEDDKCKSQINSVIFGSVLKGFSRTKQMDRMWVAFKDMLSRGIEPSVVTFNTVIDSCVRNNQVDAIDGLLKDMKSRRLEPNLITYSTVIKGVCQKGDMDAAFAVFKDLRKASDVKPDEIVYNTMLDGCSTAGLVAEGEQLLEEMVKDRLTPTNYTLTVLVRLMGHGRRLQRAFDLIDIFAQKHKVRVNSHVCSALIQACISCKDLTYAEKAFDLSMRSRAQPDQRTCQNFLRAFMTAGKANYAVSALRAFVGLSGSSAKSTQGSPQFTDSFINEMVSLLLEGPQQVRALAPALVADIRAVRPKLRLDPSTDRKLGLTVARNHSDESPPQKRHPWRQ